MDFKAGDKVVFVSKEWHEKVPRIYPPAGTIGTILGQESRTSLYVQWPRGTTSTDDKKHCQTVDVQIIDNN